MEAVTNVRVADGALRDPFFADIIWYLCGLLTLTYATIVVKQCTCVSCRLWKPSCVLFSVLERVP